MAKVSNQIKKPTHVKLLGGILRNDLEYIDNQHLRDKLYEKARFSVIYNLLLVTSVVICTLGLLTGNSSIVIGGMLISPLMWPLARLGYGMSHRSGSNLYRGLILCLVSIVVGAIAAYAITTISPIKVINEEILARTSPTLMDLFIALSAGLVAGLVITQKKLSDSIAGVAIAVSLMPPLCTVGIAFSLGNYEYSLGALLLFSVNAACITLVTTLSMIYNQSARNEDVRPAKRAIFTNIIIVLLLAIPLVQLLRNYTTQVQSYDTISSQMQSYIKTKDPDASFKNIEITESPDQSLSVDADLILPTDKTFTYDDNQNLLRSLSTSVNRQVSLNLRLQNVFEPAKPDTESEFSASTREIVEEQVKLRDKDGIISNYSAVSDEYKDKSVFDFTVTTSKPKLYKTKSVISKNIKSNLESFTGGTVELNIRLIEVSEVKL